MRYAIAFLLVLTTTISTAQNFVPDSSFESYINCPQYMGQINCPLSPGSMPTTLTDWFCPITTTTDYYNSCSSSMEVGTTTHFAGPQLPHTGEGYIGIVAYTQYVINNTTHSGYREYIECQLLQPLVAGQAYSISCYIKYFGPPEFAIDPLTNFKAIDALSVHLSTAVVTNPISPLILSSLVALQLPTQGFITDTTWVRISAAFTAVGGEQYLTMGIFNNNPLPIQQVFPPVPYPGTEIMSYYMIDDVSLRAICDTIIITHDTTLCNTQPVDLLPSPTGSSYLWNTGATTQFISPVLAGTYWRTAATGCTVYIDTFIVRSFADTTSQTSDSVLCASAGAVTLVSGSGAGDYQWNTGAVSSHISVTESGIYYCTAIEDCRVYTDTFHVSPPDTFTTLDTLTCFPSSAFITAEPGATSYSWNTSEVTSAISISQPGNYICEAIKGCNVYIRNYNIISISAIHSINLGNDTTICKGDAATIGPKRENATYLWNTGDTSHSITIPFAGAYILQIDDGCKLLSDTVIVDVVNCNDCIFMPTVFTPNRDGKNDAIGAIANCPLSSFSLTIANRFGEVVFNTKNILGKWDGLYKGERSDIGTYFYFIQYTSAVDRETKLLKGDITLIH